jgi:GTP-binding protein HflX
MSYVIVHVVDASHEDPAQQIKTVRDVVGEVEARDIPEIIVFNKADLIDVDQQILLRGLEPNAVFVSAKTGEGVEALQQLIADTIPEPDVEVTAVIPYENGEIVSMIHKSGHVLDTDYVESGTRIHARVSIEMAARIGQYVEH